MTINELHEKLNKFRRFYADARRHLSWANKTGRRETIGNALAYCRLARHELLTIMLQLRIALAVRAARRAQR